jgi:hypothetical protein
MRKFLIVVLLAAISSCASEPPVVVDTSPKNSTVVINAKGSINGYVMPDSTFEQTVYTREDRRSIAMSHTYDSWMAKKFFGSGDDTVIFRMDKSLRWVLFDKTTKKKYLECPLSGCSNDILSRLDQKQGNNNEDQFDYDPQEDTACPVKQTNNSFEVESTGETRVIAGYDAKEYRAVWLMEYQDDKGRKDKNTLTITFWNTQPTGSMEKAWAVNEAATQAYLKKIKQENNPLSTVLPDSIFSALSAFSGDTSKENKQWNNSVSRKMATAKGYPLSIKTEWRLDRKTCPEAAPKEKSLDWTNPLQALQDTASDYAGKQIEKRFMPNPDEPIFRYIYEVTKVDIQPVHDSEFEIPAGFTLVSRE